MKRSVSILLYASALALLILLVFLIGNRYHFMYNSVCGTGIAGLKFVGIIACFTLIAAMLCLWGQYKMHKIHCKKCRALMEDTWKVCPYCGTEIYGLVNLKLKK